MFSIQYFETESLVRLGLHPSSYFESWNGHWLSLRSGKWCHCSDLWKSSCALPTGGPRRLISNFSSQRALVWQEAWLLLLVRVEVGDTNTIGPIGRRDDLWPAEVVNCVSLSSSSELKLNWCCWDWSVTPIAHLRPQTVVGENSRSRGEGVSDHLLIWSYNHTFKVISTSLSDPKRALQEKTVPLWAWRDFTLGITLVAAGSHSLPIFYSAKAVALPVLLFLGKFSVLLLFPHWSLAYVAEDYLQLGFTRLHRPAWCHSARSTELYYNV